jgi:hypothetical protein
MLTVDASGNRAASCVKKRIEPGSKRPKTLIPVVEKASATR